MIDDLFLSELMDTVAQQDKEQLAEMMRRMTPDDIAYFKGFVSGYTTAVSHLQAAGVDGCSFDGVELPKIG